MYVMKQKWLLILNLLLFTNIYSQDITSSEILVEGEIEFISQLPNPKEMDYSDCNFSAIIKIHTTSKDARVAVVFKGIVNRELVKTTQFKVEDKIRVTLIPFEKASAEIRQTQLVDQIDDFDMKVYYAVKTLKINTYSKSQSPKNIIVKNEKVETISILPIDQKAAKIRKRNINSEIKRINKLLKSHGGSWEQWEKDIQDFKAEYAKATEAQESKWIENSFFSAGNAYSETNEGNFVEAMTNFNTYLKQFNIDLIVIRIPFKGEISGDLFSDKLSDYVVNPYAMKVTSDLLKNDVEVIDILPKLLEERMNHPLLFWYNDFEETHPAEAISWIIAKELKKILARYPEFEASPKIKTNVRDTTGIRNSKSYRWPKGNASFPDNKLITYKTVTDSLGKMLKLEYDKNTAPFLFIGNSFLAFPSIERGGSIPHYFTYETGLKPDVYFRSGGVGLGRLIYKRGKSYLENRRAIVYIALPQSFQGNVPVIPLAASLIEENLHEKYSFKLDKNNWNEQLKFTPQLGVGEAFSITKNGHLSAFGKNGFKSDGGDIIGKLPDTFELNKDDILKISFEFKSVGFAKIVVTYDGEEKSFLRSNNVNETYFENVYFRIGTNTENREFKIAFIGVQGKQLIKEINVSLLTSK